MEFQKKEPITFQEIIFEMIKSIGAKALIEFRGGQQKTIIKGDVMESFIEADSRKEFVQGIEFLSDLLIAEFDKETMDKYEKIMEKIKEMKKDVVDGKIDGEDYIIEKVSLMRELFRTMVFRLKETGYLKRQAVIG